MRRGLHDLPREHIEHEVEEEEHPDDRSRKIGDVPGPELIGRSGAARGATEAPGSVRAVMLAVRLAQEMASCLSVLCL